MHNIQSLSVDLAERSYPIHIGPGLLTKTAELITDTLNSQKLAIITDETVAKYHLHTLLDSLNGSGFDVETIILPPGEATKSIDVWQSVLETLLARNFSRDDTLIALGGGVIGDLTGFVASVLKRGCQFVQIPTTLLAQVDSSVGGKTAINVPAGKNLVGCFYQPKLVLIDTDVLETLPGREMGAGYAEVLKYALIDRPDFFNWLETNAQNVLDKDTDALTHIIATSCQAKADIVGADEREHGVRALLNLGHSFAHALEGIGGYDGRILHGEAVSAGMLMAFEFSNRLDLCSMQDVERLRAHIRACGLPDFNAVRKCVGGDPQTVFRFMQRDKKNSEGHINLVLTRGIGKAFIAKNVNQNDLMTYLKAIYKSKGDK